MDTIPGTITLDAEEQAMLAGEHGEAARFAIRLLTRMAPLYGADRLLPVTRAHIDGCIYSGDAGLEYAELLAGMGGTVRVPTSLNVVSLDRARWRQLGIPAPYADSARRLADAYIAMGATPTFTCAPYQTSARPDFGEQIAWSESNAVAFANSVCGARTNRYGDFLDIACALAGRVPASGLHLNEPRLATTLIELAPLPPGLTERGDFWPVLGYLIGALVTDDVPVVGGLAANPTEDQLKSLCAAAASSGSVALVHLAGITPEAPAVADALGGRTPARIIRAGLPELLEARRSLTTTNRETVDIVAFGSPHCSLAECRHIARLASGHRVASGVTVFITTSRAVRDLLDRSGDLATLEAFGARVVADTCIVVAPPLVPDGAQVLMTDSAKYAHYGPGLLGMDAVYGSTEACIASAMSGRVVRDDTGWTP
jgi:predicted aconitase